MLIGAHVSPAGGPAKAVERGIERGCRLDPDLQPEPAPVAAARSTREDEIADFHVAMEASDVDALLIHAVYLLNPASEDTEIRDKTLASLTTSLRMGAALGAVGVVLHPGSALKTARSDPALERAAEVIAEALAESETARCTWRTPPALAARSAARSRSSRGCSSSPAATSGSGSAWTPATCYASGYDIRTARALGAVLDEFDRVVGIDRLGLAAHQRLRRRAWLQPRPPREPGDGEIGRKGCAAFLSEPRFEGLPCVLEGPGAKGKAVDADDMAWALKLRRQGLRARRA